MQIFAHQMSRPASTTLFPLLNEASVIEIADIWPSASIPSDHSCDYRKLLFLRKNGAEDSVQPGGLKRESRLGNGQTFSAIMHHSLCRT